MRKTGIEMQLPDGKRPGYYAQVVKSLADVPLFDRDKETLIVSDETGREAVIELMNEFKFEFEELDLLLLPDGASLRPSFSDYGFESRSGNCYLLEHLTALFRFVPSGADTASRQAALLQMEEHLIASFVKDGESLYAVDQTFIALMHGIAKAYECRIEAVESAS